MAPKDEDLDQRLGRIEKLLLAQKEVLDFNETLEYTGLSASYLYKLTSNNGIPCYCPGGKKLYFNRKELDDWMLQNRRASKHEIEKNAENHIVNTNNHGK